MALADFCLRAIDAGPRDLSRTCMTTEGWAIASDGAAAADLHGKEDSFHPLVTIPTKLATLGAAYLHAVGRLLQTAGPAPEISIAPLGRAVAEGCGSVAWVLDDRVAADERHLRAWLLWAVAEGKAAVTAEADAGRTGAMSGSPQRLAEIESSLIRQLGMSLERSEKSKPKDWRLAGVAVPGPRQLVVEAVDRWFPGADGSTLYSQVSRQAHSDVLVALALVDMRLQVPKTDGIEFVPTTLALWGLTWGHVLSYLGLRSMEFERWRDGMLVATNRADLIDGL